MRNLLFNFAITLVVEVNGFPDLFNIGQHRFNPHPALNRKRLQGQNIGRVGHSHLHCISFYAYRDGIISPCQNLGNQLQCLRVGRLA